MLTKPQSRTILQIQHIQIKYTSNGGKEDEEHWNRIWDNLVYRLAFHHQLCRIGLVGDYSRDSGLAILPGAGGRVKYTQNT